MFGCMGFIFLSLVEVPQFFSVVKCQSFPIPVGRRWLLRQIGGPSATDSAGQGISVGPFGKRATMARPDASDLEAVNGEQWRLHPDRASAGQRPSLDGKYAGQAPANASSSSSAVQETKEFGH